MICSVNDINATYRRRSCVRLTFAAGCLALLMPRVVAIWAQPSSAPKQMAALAVTVEFRDTFDYFTAEAVIEAIRQSTLAAQMAGRIVERGIKVGDTVKAGQVLARIDARAAGQSVTSTQSQLAEADALLVNARTRHERNQKLQTQNFISAAALDQSAAELRAAQARVDALRAGVGMAVTERSYATIAAPYAGVVGATHVELGDMAQPGRALITIFDPAQMRVTATVSQTALQRIDLSQPVRIELVSGTKSVTSQVARIVPLVDTQTHTAKIRVDLPPMHDLLPGEFARAYFVTGRSKKLTIPVQSVLRRSEVTAAYVIDKDGVAHLRQIRTGDTLPEGWIEVLAGLSAGEQVARDPVAVVMVPAASAGEQSASRGLKR
jgi:RND family efflux transporter MFP subunit